MASDVRFLLGFGERLTESIAAPQTPHDKRDPYKLDEAQIRLSPMVKAASDALDELPSDACPRDESVAIVTLHPEYLAKSYFPDQLLREAGLRTVGSRPRAVKPEKWTKKKPPETAPSTDLFVAGPRSSFRHWATTISGWDESKPALRDLPKVEQVRAEVASDRLRSLPGDTAEYMMEVVLHASRNRYDDFILEAFESYAKRLGIEDVESQLDRRLYAGGLCFFPLASHSSVLRELASFSFLRVARKMPRLRPLTPLRSWSPSQTFPTELPEEGPLNPDLRVAVFDGGVHASAGLDRWIDRRRVKGVGPATSEFQAHGAKVSSALLFGSLIDGQEADRPYAGVDHFRVLDENSGSDEDLYDVLHRIRSILLNRNYRFVNISLGPEMPIDDDEVHGWTAVLDDLLADGDCLAAIAAGNGGERDASLGFNRVQVPGDTVNGLSVGASDSVGKIWRRAAYSSVGPGRSPGLVKPDLVAFGGSSDEPFWTSDPSSNLKAVPAMGTSFAAPAALRTAVGIRTHFGEILNPLALKALLIHNAVQGELPREEVGWGRLPTELEDFVVCPEGTARIVYQGELTARQYMRAAVPVPEEEMKGFVTIGATFCFATETDADHPGNYTRAGLDVVFRPHDQKFSDRKDGELPLYAKSDSFFQLKEFSTERELRWDAHKWETALHREKRKRGSSLRNPVFDVHYNAREGSRDGGVGGKIQYALVITVQAPRVKDLYDRIVQRYPTQLQPLRPRLEIPIRTRT